VFLPICEYNAANDYESGKASSSHVARPRDRNSLLSNVYDCSQGALLVFEDISDRLINRQNGDVDIEKIRELEVAEMGVLTDKERLQLKKIFDTKLEAEVKLVMFTQEFECETCKDTKDLVLELSELSPKIKAEIYDFSKDKEKVKEYNIDKIPAIALVGKKKYGIRFFGAPSGYEFMALIEDMADVSTGKTKLSAQTKDKLQSLTKPLHIQVFTTPTCPYCPQDVRLVHQFAIENESIRADMVEAVEFPFLCQRYSVISVPKVVINETINFVGALPEERFIEYLLTAQSKSETTMFT
jgi:glutaredoxin-like protein